MPQSWDMGQILSLPLRRKACGGSNDGDCTLMTCHTRGLSKHVRYEVQLSHFYLSGRLQRISQHVHWGSQGLSRRALCVTFNIGKPPLDSYVPNTSNFLFSHYSTNSPFPPDTAPKACDNPASLILWVRLAGLSKGPCEITWNLFVCHGAKANRKPRKQGSRKTERDIIA